MGYLHEAWTGTPSTITKEKNARGQAVPTSTDGGYTADFVASEAEQNAKLNAERKAKAAQKVACKALATKHFGDGVELFGLLSDWPLDGRESGWRATRGGKTVGFIAVFADRLEAWSACGHKPHERLE